MNDMMNTPEARKILEIASKHEIHDDEDVYQIFIYHLKELGLPENLSLDFILWVIANDRMKGSKCESCYFVPHACLAYQGHHLNHCNDCAYNPTPMLRVLYRSVQSIGMNMYYSADS